METPRKALYVGISGYCPSACILHVIIFCYSSAFVNSFFRSFQERCSVEADRFFFFQLMQIRFSVRARCQPRVYSAQSIGLTSTCQFVYECPRGDQKTAAITTVLCLHYGVLMMTALGLLFPERIQVLIGIFCDDFIGIYHVCTGS
jgi:hypothetical protein